MVSAVQKAHIVSKTLLQVNGGCPHLFDSSVLRTVQEQILLGKDEQSPNGQLCIHPALYAKDLGPMFLELSLR